MRKAEVYYNNKLAGYLFENNNKYFFKYNEQYLLDNNPSVSLTLPKSKEVFTSKYLFPFFFGLLSEGENRKLQCANLKIDENDYFDMLLKTSGHDTAGGITVREL